MSDYFPMPTLDAEDRIVILLYVLGDQVAQSALAQLAPKQAAVVRRRLDEFKQRPPLPEAVDEVLQDFEHSLRLASDGPTLHIFRESALEPATTKTLAAAALDSARKGGAPSRPPVAHEPAASYETTAAAGPTRDGHTAVEDEFEITDDPIGDLNRLPGLRLARALKDENPRTVAMVLGCLPSDKAADILRHLSDSLRSQAFMTLSRMTNTSSPLLQRIVKTIVAKAAAIQDASDEQSDTDRKMADMLRALPKKSRTQIMEILDGENPELSGRLKGLLYFFEDLLRVEDRSLQRLLMELDVETLLTALRGADEAILEKIMHNVSKRVRETLTEEMQYATPVPEERIEEARSAVVKSMAQLDQQGQLVIET